MREVVLDTETTGLDPRCGHRIVEIGCVELFNTIPTVETFHVYINPERDMPEEAFRVHGLSTAFLADKPVFASIAAEFLSFIGVAKIVAHNAHFDLTFLNAELVRIGIKPIAANRVIDTLALARRKFPHAANSLDALCLRYGIDTSERTKHGALLDAEILAEIYAELVSADETRIIVGDGTGSEESDTPVPAFEMAYSHKAVHKNSRNISLSWSESPVVDLLFLLSCVIIVLPILTFLSDGKDPAVRSGSNSNEKDTVTYAIINASKLNIRTCPDSRCSVIATLA